MPFCGCKQCYQMPLLQPPTLMTETKLTYTTVMIRGETQTVGGPITCLVTFCLAPNPWSLTWSRYFVSVIITTFLVYTWRVVPRYKISIHSRSDCFDGLSGQTERENMLILLFGTTRKHRISLMSIVIITDTKCHKGWLHKMSPSM